MIQAANDNAPLSAFAQAFGARLGSVTRIEFGRRTRLSPAQQRLNALRVFYVALHERLGLARGRPSRTRLP